LGNSVFINLATSSKRVFTLEVTVSTVSPSNKSSGFIALTASQAMSSLIFLPSSSIALASPLAAFSISFKFSAFSTKSTWIKSSETSKISDKAFRVPYIALAYSSEDFFTSLFAVFKDFNILPHSSQFSPKVSTP
jgi:hypothetical protein